MIEYNSIYKNGKPEYFFLKIDNPKDFNFIQPYFLVTDCDHTRKGRIREMDVLYSYEVWKGKQTHGYGYSSCSDVYDTLVEIILNLYKKELSEESKNELKALKTHDERLTISDKTLSELETLNAKTLHDKLERI